MYSEKKSLKRFLIVYILSTLFLLLIGSFFYYKTTKQSMIELHISQMKSNIEKFIKLNIKSKFLQAGKKPIFLDFPISIFINKKYIVGNFKSIDIDFSKRYIIKYDNLYSIHKEHKPWGNTYIVTYMNISQDIINLKKEVFIFLLISIIFIIFVSFLLGNIFLKPMKDSIKMLEDFISDTTHEINTPISNILINIEFIDELYPNCKDVEELHKIKNSAFRVSKIFKDLSYVKLNHKQKKYITTIDVDKILLERLEFFHTFIINKNLTIKTNIVPTKIDIDKEDLIRLIDNLISNSIKYTQIGGEINIKLDKYFTITNDGNINDVSKVKLKFQREAKDEGGFGLGLYIVQKIVDLYNFKFELYTNANKVVAKIYFS